tara:strand:- start:2949 stop:3533 length:585 start_codon:yes stop_codon:yes gene_type:complete
MACSIVTAGRSISCQDGIGGIRRVWIGGMAGQDVTSYPATAFVVDGTSDEVTTLKDNTTGTPADLDMYTYELTREKSMMDVTITGDQGTGTYSFEQKLTLTFKTLLPADTDRIVTLAKSSPPIIVEDNNQKLYLLGAQYGCVLTGGSILTGTSFNDAGGFSLEFSSRQLYPVYLCTYGSSQATPLDAITGLVQV